MKYISLLVVACLALSSPSEAVAPFFSNAAGTKSIPNSYIVVLKNDTAANSFGLKFTNLMNGGRPLKVDRFTAFPGFLTTLDTANLNKIRDMDEVEYVEQNAIFSIRATQANPPSWGLPRSSQRAPLTNFAASYLYADAAGAGVTVYIVDTGINAKHKDFEDRAVQGANFVTGSPNTDENGHGTHVAGTIGGKKYGIAKKVRLVGVKVLDGEGNGSTAGVLSGLSWVITDHQKKKGNRSVVNMSLGGPKSKAVNDVAAGLFKAGVAVVAAA
ncbi:subtilisin-like serine protease, partial [Modicella reniformis]